MYFDVSAQIQTNMYMLGLRAYKLEFMLAVLTIHCKNSIVTNRSDSMNDSKRPVAVSSNTVSVFENALTMF